VATSAAPITAPSVVAMMSLSMAGPPVGVGRLRQAPRRCQGLLQIRAQREDRGKNRNSAGDRGRPAPAQLANILDHLSECDAKPDRDRQSGEIPDAFDFALKIFQSAVVIDDNGELLAQGGIKALRLVRATLIV